MDTLTIALVFFCSIDNGLPDNEGVRRLEKAIALYQKRPVNRIMISGGCRNQVKLTGIYKEYLIDRGVEESDIIMEDESNSTGSSVKETSNKLGVMECDGIKIEKIRLISNFRHLRRINIVRRHHFWPWSSEDAPIRPDEKVSPAWLEFLKLVITVIDPLEKSIFVKRFKTKRAKTNS